MEITIEVNFFYDFARRDCNGNVNAEIYATLHSFDETIVWRFN